jgi:hypothetical protein
MFWRTLMTDMADDDRDGGPGPDHEVRIIEGDEIVDVSSVVDNCRESHPWRLPETRERFRSGSGIQQVRARQVTARVPGPEQLAVEGQTK